jgi:hypothetical protein
MRYQASEGATYDYAPILQPGSKHGEWFTRDRERLYSVLERHNFVRMPAVVSFSLASPGWQRTRAYVNVYGNGKVKAGGPDFEVSARLLAQIAQEGGLL